MTDTAQEQAFYRAPTFRERFWRKAGFHYHLGDEPEGVDGWQGWMKTDIHLHFGWADRLRLMLTGRLFVASVVHMDTPSPMNVKSRVDFRIVTPGETD